MSKVYFYNDNCSVVWSIRICPDEIDYNTLLLIRLSKNSLFNNWLT